MFVIAIMAIVPPEMPRGLVLVLVLAFFGWTVPARIIGAQAGAVNARAFVEAARATGAPPWQIIRREMLPHLFGLVVVLFAMSLPGNVSVVAGCRSSASACVATSPTSASCSRTHCRGSTAVRTSGTCSFRAPWCS